MTRVLAAITRSPTVADARSEPIDSPDGGATFQKILGSNTGGDIHFFDNNNGYILCGTRIYSTSNGAQTLNLLSRFSSASPLYEIHFTDASHGWVVADGGYIYRYVKP